MRLPIFRFTVRRMMLVVALAVIPFSIKHWKDRRVASFQRRAAFHIAEWTRLQPTHPRPVEPWLAYHRELALKYGMAVHRPWSPVAPDPPEPSEPSEPE